MLLRTPPAAEIVTYNIIAFLPVNDDDRHHEHSIGTDNVANTIDGIVKLCMRISQTANTQVYVVLGLNCCSPRMRADVMTSMEC